MRHHVLAAAFAGALSSLAGAQISMVDPGTLTTTDVEDFDALAGGLPPGTNYDGIIAGAGISFAERFVGQILSFNGDFDVVMGNPSGPLALQVGDPNENLNVLFDLDIFSNVLNGLGPLGYPDIDAIGEGAVAILLAIDHFELGIDVTGVGDVGDVTFDFFRRDGSFIDSLSFDPVSNGSFAFRRDGNTEDIAGVVITNTDPAGLGYDDVRYNAPAQELILPVDIKPGSCPNPLNRRSNGVLPVGLLGTPDFDITQVDVSSVVIFRADGMGGSASPNEGPPGPHSVFDDVGTPFEGELCDCHELGGDGIVDLSMKFRTQNVVDTLELDDLPGGELVELVVSGTLLDGTPFVGSDCVRLVPPGPPPGVLAIASNRLGVFIAVTPADETVDGGGFADFERTFPLGTYVTVTAPAAVEGWVFAGWEVGDPGAFNVQRPLRKDWSIDILVLEDRQTVQAVYRRRPLGNQPAD
ncbi:MAG: hypothetical protein ACYS0G_12590 [Planctomycetota bacterium]|jgi:hypothetical protein